MKGTIIIVIAVFVITATAKTSKGKKCCCDSGSSKKPERKKADENRNIVLAGTKEADGNRNIVVAGTKEADENTNVALLHERKKADDIRRIVLFGNSTALGKYLHPVFKTRKICCLCKLPLCVCKICKNPESWFLNPQLRAEKQEKTETSSPKPVKVTGREAKVRARSTATRVKEYNKQNRKAIYVRKGRKGGFRLQSDCMKCKLWSTGQCGVILKCECCGPLHLNGTSKKINFSKLLFKMNNKLNVNTKFLEISHS